MKPVLPSDDDTMYIPAEWDARSGDIACLLTHKDEFEARYRIGTGRPPLFSTSTIVWGNSKRNLMDFLCEDIEEIFRSEANVQFDGTFRLLCPENTVATLVANVRVDYHPLVGDRGYCVALGQEQHHLVDPLTWDCIDLPALTTNKAQVIMWLTLAQKLEPLGPRPPEWIEAEEFRVTYVGLRGSMQGWEVKMQEAESTSIWLFGAQIGFKYEACVTSKSEHHTVFHAMVVDSPF